MDAQVIIHSLGVVFLGIAAIMSILGYRRHIPQKEIPAGRRFVRG